MPNIHIIHAESTILFVTLSFITNFMGKSFDVLWFFSRREGIMWKEKQEENEKGIGKRIQ